MAGRVAILGIFVVDLTFRSARLPRMGETLIGSGFALGPGGKGSNQAVAAARAGAKVSFITKIGDDMFGQLGRQTWEPEGIEAHAAIADVPTGAADIFVDDATGDNAIIVYPGASGTLAPADVEASREAIAAADIFVVQLEQPHDAALRGLQIARECGKTTVFNPAPAAKPIAPEFFGLCDYIVPNESEAHGLTGIEVTDEASAEEAAAKLLEAGARTAVLTLGERGAMVRGAAGSASVPAAPSGAVRETTGAGDSFVGAFAAALAEGQDALAAVAFGCAAAGISVTRPGTAPSMPLRSEIDARLAG